MKRALAVLLLALAGCVSTGTPSTTNLAEAARINTQLGIDYMRKGQIEAAMEKLQRAIDQDPNYSVAHSSIAFVYQQRGDYRLAEKHYRKALALDVENASARNNFGVFLCSQGNAFEAERYFLEAAHDRRYPTPEAAWTNAGVCVKPYDATKAEGYFREALKINGEFPDALAQMAAVSYAGKDHLKARAFMQRFEAVGKPTAETLWIAAQTERALGDELSARKYEARLKRDFPQSHEAAQLDKKAERAP